MLEAYQLRLLRENADCLRIKGQREVPLIVGGIGPASGIDLLNDLLKVNESAVKDQEHIGYGFLNYTNFPDRTAAITAAKKGDLRLFEEIQRKITRVMCEAKIRGFGYTAFICNTIHYWYDKVPHLVPWVHMQKETGRMIKQKFPDAKKIGVMSTVGTNSQRLYPKALIPMGLTVIAPEVNSDIQQKISEAIYKEGIGVKATRNEVTDEAVNRIIEAIDWLQGQGAEVIVLGCTELSTIKARRPEEFEKYKDVLHFADPLEAVGLAIHEVAMGKRDISSLDEYYDPDIDIQTVYNWLQTKEPLPSSLVPKTALLRTLTSTMYPPL